MALKLLVALLVLPLEIRPLPIDSEASIRGIAVSPTGELCVSGAGPEVWVSTDNGATWSNRTPKIEGVTDYRSASMPSQGVILLASAGAPAVILKSDDHGKSWRTTLRDDRPEAFLDSLRFWDTKHGIAMGDPIDGQFMIMTTDDGGESWNEVKCSVPALGGEAGFAASNGSISLVGDRQVLVGLGGRKDGGPSRVLRSDDRGESWSVVEIDCIPANASSGIFSIHVRPDGFGIAVGGDYKEPEDPAGNIALTRDHGRTWTPITKSKPAGFRSSVVFVSDTESQNGNDGSWVTTGPSGTEISRDGLAWETVDVPGFHALRVIDHSKILFAGSEGRVAIITSQRD